MQDDASAIAGYWLNAAEVDLNVANEVAERYPQVACSHAQQVAEKGMKALLVLRAGDAPRSHMVTDLLDDLSAVDVIVPSEVSDAATALQRHYLPSRYPDALGGGDPARMYRKHDADLAIEQAFAVHAWVRAEMHRNLAS